MDGPSWPILFEGSASHAYLRFHGRNADVWHRGRKVENDPEDPRMNRYDDFYSEKALEPWADRVRDLAEEKTVRTYFNNDEEAMAILDAEELGDQVERLTGERVLAA